MCITDNKICLIFSHNEALALDVVALRALFAPAAAATPLAGTTTAIALAGKVKFRTTLCDGCTATR